MRPIELFPFRYRDPVSGKWKRARYVATREEIAARNTEWEIIGPPEIWSGEPVRMYIGKMATQDRSGSTIGAADDVR